MSENRARQEPSMEEILSSIRRIISEDDVEAETEAEAPAQVPRPKAGPAKEALAKEAAPEDEGVLELTEEAGGDDVLVLSEVAEEDAAPDATAQDEPAADPDNRGFEEDFATELAGMEAERETSSTSDADADADAGADADDDLPFDDAPMPAFDPRAAMPAPDPEPAPRRMTASTLLSDTAAAAATRSLSDLVQRVEGSGRRGADMAIGDGHTLEEIVAMLLRPMLKEWLDQNLPPMVDRLVKQEIRRLVRQAEE